MKNFLLLIILAIGLYACELNTLKTYKDGKIDKALRNKIDQLDDIVIASVLTNNPKKIKSIMSDVLLEKSGEKIDQLIDEMGLYIKTDDYKVLNQFYVRNTTEGSGNAVKCVENTINDYLINYKALNKEMFISVLECEGGLSDFLVTCIYGKYPDGWKINILQFGLYRINNQTAPELYMSAKKLYEKGCLVDAANYMILSSNVATPANKFWQYLNANDMKDFYDKVMSEATAKYSFPIRLDDIETHPEIFNIAPLVLEEGYFPLIEYQTEIDLQDTVQTKLENDKIHRQIADILEGIEKENTTIIYRAYNEKPDGSKQVPYYGFVRDVE